MREEGLRAGGRADEGGGAKGGGGRRAKGGRVREEELTVREGGLRVGG